MTTKAVIDVGPIQALAIAAVFQGYMTYKAARLIADLAWCSITRRELAPFESRHQMRSRLIDPPLLRVIEGGQAA